MQSSPTVALYLEPSLVHNHNPTINDSFENGQRVNIDPLEYSKLGCQIVRPRYQAAYFRMLEQVHGSNPMYVYLTETSFKKTIWQRLTGRHPKHMQTRNCRCSTETTLPNCHECGTLFTEDNFKRFVFNIDPKVIYPDTTYFTHTSLKAVRDSVSLVCQMVDGLRAKTVDHGFAFVRPPGHHAHCHKSWGFCLVNNLAVGVKYALTRGFNRVFVFDIDAHHGDGTQSIFYQDPNVFYCSIHTAESFPKTGLPEEQGEGEGFGFNLNCVVPKGVSANAYLEVFHDQVRPAIEAYKPDLVLVSAGFDGLDTDPMQIMKLEPATYGTIVAALKEVSQAPVGLVLEGGYDVSRLNHCYHACISSLLG